MMSVAWIGLTGKRSTSLFIALPPEVIIAGKGENGRDDKSVGHIISKNEYIVQ
jgi:hypothetical protein